MSQTEETRPGGNGTGSQMNYSTCDLEGSAVPSVVSRHGTQLGPVTATCPHCQRPAHDGLLCHACMRQARSDLADLPWLYLEVRRTAVGLARLTESGPGRSAEKPLPVNLHASRVADRIRASLVGWIRATQQAAAQCPRDSITHMCSHLHARLPKLRQREDIDEMCTDLQRLVGQAARAASTRSTTESSATTAFMPA